MCAGREHRYRVTMKVTGRENQDVVVYATGVSHAVAKADGWAHKHFPDAFVSFEVTRSGYREDASAQEHGAILQVAE